MTDSSPSIEAHTAELDEVVEPIASEEAPVEDILANEEYEAEPAEPELIDETPAVEPEPEAEKSSFDWPSPGTMKKKRKGKVQEGIWALERA